MKSYLKGAPCATPMETSGGEILAGPYLDKPTTHLGVNLAANNKRPANLTVDWPDFGVPTDLEAVKEAVRFVLRSLIYGHKVYVGCGFGWGRTGTLLALVARVTEGLNGPKAIDFVRQNYRVEAVETNEQERFVATFPVFWLRIYYGAERLWAKFFSARG